MILLLAMLAEGEERRGNRRLLCRGGTEPGYRAKRVLLESAACVGGASG